ncbi:unnamed protein product [Urochloa humidicola]
MSSSMALRSLLRRIAGRPGALLPRTGPAAHGPLPQPPASRRFMGTASPQFEPGWRMTLDKLNPTEAELRAFAEQVQRQTERQSKEIHENIEAARRSLDKHKRSEDKAMKVFNRTLSTLSGVMILAFFGIQYEYIDIFS